jgi:hypothetical protein
MLGFVSLGGANHCVMAVWERDSPLKLSIFVFYSMSFVVRNTWFKLASQTSQCLTLIFAVFLKMLWSKYN